MSPERLISLARVPEEKGSAGDRPRGDELFENSSLKDFLELDDRPTCVFNAQSLGALELLFMNQALVDSQQLLQAINELNYSGNDKSEFAQWVNSGSGDDLNAITLEHHHPWRRMDIAGKWLVLQTTERAQARLSSFDGESGPKAEVLLDATSVQYPERDGHLIDTNMLASDDETVSPSFPSIDWFQESVASPSAYVEFFRNFHWDSTPLGPMNVWPPELRMWCNTMMADHVAGLILWGPSLNMLYNQACVQVIGEKHPAALGGEPKNVFGELWPYLEAMVDLTKRTGKATEQSNLSLPMIRHGFVEETYWTFSMLPIIGPDGSAVAIYDRFTESTDVAVAERRMSTLLKIGELATSSGSLKDFWQHILRVLDENSLDAPFAAVYSVCGTNQSGTQSGSIFTTEISTKQCLLEGQIGVPPERDHLPRVFNLAAAGEDITTSFTQAWKQNQPVLLRRSDGTLPESLYNQRPDRAFGDPCNAAVVLPIRFALENSLIALIVLGINPRRPYNQEYKGYITLLHRRLVDAAAIIFLPEEERRYEAQRREENLRQASLAARLLTRTHEAEEKQNRFMRLAEHAPIGMTLYDDTGKPIFFNDAYFEMTGQNRVGFEPFRWLDIIHDDDIDYVRKEWDKLIHEGLPITIQHRVKKPWNSISKADRTEISGETWLLSSSFPFERKSSGRPSSIMGWTLDISYQKWAESLQKQRLEDALETKRQSERFIDMTSHEMRNPLSAILQAADGITMILNSEINKENAGHTSMTLKCIAENAQIINLCAQHQKRIVDDILALSKLDSKLLLVTPDKTDPIALLRHALKMYDAEFENNDITVNLIVEDSYRDMRIDNVFLDPSRLLQVIINLLTNAIKFTSSESRRIISVSIGASSTKPLTGPRGSMFFPTCDPSLSSSVMEFPQVAEGPVFILFSVQDSGRGMEEKDKKLLFLRFSQVSPRTHVQYGGSGLGLFISRQLTELQGGQIGVSSDRGKGSIFEFYIEARMCPRSEQESRIIGADPIARPLTEAPAQKQPISEVVIKLDSGKTVHVLVVEDNIINQKVMSQQLMRLGCNVHVANHGGEALQFIERSTLNRSTTHDLNGLKTNRREPVELDIVLMDLEMPVMDGLTCVRHIRQFQRTGTIIRHVPIICITANAREAQIADAKAQGCDSVVTKPFRIPDLMNHIKKLLAEPQL